MQLILSFITMFLLCAPFSVAQQDTTAQAELAALREAIQKDRAAVDALVLYPEEIGNAIFEASLYPEVIAKLAAIQSTSSSSFKKFIVALPQKEQEQYYEIVRYSGLVDALVDAQKSDTKIVDSLQKYPKAIGETALQVGTNAEEYDRLVNIYHLNRSVQEIVNHLLQSYPEPAQAAFRTLIGHPEILSILNEKMNFTVLLGALYKKDPAFTKERAKAAHDEAVKRSGQIILEWTAELQKNPTALSELQNSAKSYALEKGYDPEKALAATTEAETDNAARPYPYWFGYPSWYSSPYWYPYPPYYDCGFYYSSTGVLTITGLPSYEFVDWLLRDPENLMKYPHLADQFLTRYESHPGSTDSFTTAVGSWYVQQKEQIPMQWLTRDANRAARLKEYGRLQQEAAAQKLSLAMKKEYIEVHGESYPGLNFRLPTPSELLYVPKPPYIEFQAPSQDLMYFRAVDFQYSYWGNPYRGQLVSVSVPIEKPKQ